jgi:hypothetical protein
MNKTYTSEEIKYRLSDLGVQIGNIAIEYITELEKENAELKAQIEKNKIMNKTYTSEEIDELKNVNVHDKSKKRWGFYSMLGE